MLDCDTSHTHICQPFLGLDHVMLASPQRDFVHFLRERQFIGWCSGARCSWAPAWRASANYFGP